MMGGRMGRYQTLPNGAGFTIFKIKIAKQVKKSKPLLRMLSEIRPLQQDEAVNYYRPRRFYLTMIALNENAGYSIINL